MFERLFAFMFTRREKTNAAITVVRRDRRCYAEECAFNGERDFKDEQARAEFFKAVFCSRTRI